METEATKYIQAEQKLKDIFKGSTEPLTISEAHQQLINTNTFVSLEWVRTHVKKLTEEGFLQRYKYKFLVEYAYKVES